LLPTTFSFKAATAQRLNLDARSSAAPHSARHGSDIGASTAPTRLAAEPTTRQDIQDRRELIDAQL
jgi:hypothetical protein